MNRDLVLWLWWLLMMAIVVPQMVFLLQPKRWDRLQWLCGLMILAGLIGLGRLILLGRLW